MLGGLKRPRPAETERQAGMLAVLVEVPCACIRSCSSMVREMPCQYRVPRYFRPSAIFDHVRYCRLLARACVAAVRLPGGAALPPARPAHHLPRRSLRAYGVQQACYASLILRARRRTPRSMARSSSTRGQARSTRYCRFAYACSPMPRRAARALRVPRVLYERREAATRYARLLVSAKMAELNVRL